MAAFTGGTATEHVLSTWICGTRPFRQGIYLEITCIFNRSLMAAFKAKAGESAWGGVRGEALLA